MTCRTSTAASDRYTIRFWPEITFPSQGMSWMPGMEMKGRVLLGREEEMPLSPVRAKSTKTVPPWATMLRATPVRTVFASNFRAKAHRSQQVTTRPRCRRRPDGRAPGVGAGDDPHQGRPEHRPFQGHVADARLLGHHRPRVTRRMGAVDRSTMNQ
jgi:hypothetical protein